MPSEADNPENRPEKRKTEDSESVESKKAREDEPEILKRFQANFDSFSKDPELRKGLLEALDKKKKREEEAPRHNVQNLIGSATEPSAQQQIFFMLGMISTQLNTQQNQLNALKLGQDRINAALPQLVAPVPQQRDPRLVQGAPRAHAPGAQMGQGLMGQGPSSSSPVTPRAPRPQFVIKKDKPGAQLNAQQGMVPGRPVYQPAQMMHHAPGPQHPQAPQGLTPEQIQRAQAGSARSPIQAPQPIAPAQMMHHVPIQAPLPPRPSPQAPATPKPQPKPRAKKQRPIHTERHMQPEFVLGSDGKGMVFNQNKRRVYRPDAPAPQSNAPRVRLQDPTAPWTLRIEPWYLQTLNIDRPAGMTIAGLSAMAIYNSPNGSLQFDDIVHFINHHFPRFLANRKSSTWRGIATAVLNDKNKPYFTHLSNKKNQKYYQFSPGVSMTDCFNYDCWAYVLCVSPFSDKGRTPSYYNEIMEGKDEFLENLQRRPNNN